MANHVVLLGDSIFDNQAYVRPDPAVIEQLREELPPGWRATLLAVDGSVTSDVAAQLRQVPHDASHLVVSAGGNDALGASGILAEPARSAWEVFARLADVQDRFREEYEAMLDALLAPGRAAAVCTVYDPNYGDDPVQRLARVGLSVFNDVITRAAARRGLPVIDLRVAFDSPGDYANPIEPSAVGGRKLARLLRHLVTGHDFARRRATLYSGEAA